MYFATAALQIETLPVWDVLPVLLEGSNEGDGKCNMKEDWCLLCSFVGFTSPCWEVSVPYEGMGWNKPYRHKGFSPLMFGYSGCGSPLWGQLHLVPARESDSIHQSDEKSISKAFSLGLEHNSIHILCTWLTSPVTLTWHQFSAQPTHKAFGGSPAHKTGRPPHAPSLF